MAVYTPKDLQRFFPWKNVAEYHSVSTCAKRQRKGKGSQEKAGEASWQIGKEMMEICEQYSRGDAPWATQAID